MKVARRIQIAVMVLLGIIATDLVSTDCSAGSWVRLFSVPGSMCDVCDTTESGSDGGCFCCIDAEGAQVHRGLERRILIAPSLGPDSKPISGVRPVPYRPPLVS